MSEANFSADEASWSDEPSSATTDESLGDEGLEDLLGATSTIGRAVQSLMTRSGLDEEQAFTELVRLAESCQVRLRDAAADVVSAADSPAPLGGEGPHSP